MGLILDTSIFIEAERKGLAVAGLLKRVQENFGQEEIAFTTISVAELEHGIWRARDPERELRRRRFLEDLLAAVPPYPLTTSVGRHVGRVDADCRKKGFTIPFQDLVIGVTALEFDYSVLTLNLRHFKLIPSLIVKTI